MSDDAKPLVRRLSFVCFLAAISWSLGAVGQPATQPRTLGPNPLMAESSSTLQLPESYLTTGAVDAGNGFAYFGTLYGQIVKVRLSDLSRDGGLELQGYEARSLKCAVLDETAGYGYFGTDTSPGMVIKVRLSDMTRVSALTFGSGENIAASAAIDPAAGFAYFGLSTSPGKIVRVRLSDFTQVDTLTLNSDEGWLYGATIDPSAGFAYFGSANSPARIVKVRLSDFTRVGAVTLNTGENGIGSAAIDPAAGFAYFITSSTPISVVKVRLSDLARVATTVFNYNPGSYKRFASTIDPASGLGYFASDDFPSRLSKHRLSDLGWLETLTFRSGENGPVVALIDPSAGYAYFGTWTSLGRVVRVDLGSTTTAVTSSPNPSTLGGAVALDAHVTSLTNPAPPTGAVSFFDNGVGLAGCSAVPLDALAHAVCTTTALGVGNHAISATYAGDATFSPSTGAAGHVVGLAVTITAPATVCANGAGQAASVADLGPDATYAWSIANGAITTGAGTRTVIFSAGPSGPLTLGATATVGTTSATDTKDVAVVELPSALISAPAAVCASQSGVGASVADAGPAATYVWTISGGTIISGTGTPTIAFTAGASGSVSVGVTITTASGCTSSSSRSIVINSVPTAVVTTPGSVCASSAGNTASVPDAGAGAVYSWSVTGATINAGSGTRSITWTAGPSGLATVSVTVGSAAGCSSSGSASVTITALPSASITAATSVRKNSTNNAATVPSAGTGATYAWAISNGTITSGAGTASIRYRAGGRGTLTLNVTVRNASGCSKAGSRTVTVTN